MSEALDFILETFSRGSLILAAIFIITVWAWFLLLTRYSFICREKSDFSEVTTRVLSFIAGRDETRAAVYLNKQNNSFSRMLLRLVRSREKSKKILQRTIDETMVDLQPNLKRDLGTISSFAKSAPLLGLLGTVTGMVKTFDVIHLFGSSNPMLMADGISEALITTQAGLLASFPILLFLAYIRSRLKIMEMQFEKNALRVLNFYNRRKK